MDWSIYGAVTGTTGTILSLCLALRVVFRERSNLNPYITEWSTIQTPEGFIIIKVKLFVQNRSRVDNTVELVYLKPRRVRNFSFEVAKYQTYVDPSSMVNRVGTIYQGSKMEEVCSKDEAFPLPLNIKSNATEGGWLAFIISPDYVQRARQYKWFIEVVDQLGRHYTTSNSTRDQTINKP
jgi:hypothetical protein